ncbi:apotyrosinase chaperone MelC1 [Streptomyces sp. bgisy100]|uniref:apotyrosinase chaperone MelC1 n=1 Tax=Streptomyces sp. bgisy100 TaxID=3413783 RepID=UPI003D764233
MSHPTRRHVLRGSAVALAGAALAAPAAIAATRSDAAAPHHGHAEAGTPEIPEAFDEVYEGRHIEGWPAPQDGGHGGHGGHEGMDFVVRIDDKDLHVMRNVDTTWISVVNHYETHPTPRSVARAAVRELNGSRLVPVVTG